MNDEGQKIYSDFLNYQNKWLEYIRPIAIKEFNDKLDSLNKKYYRYAYLNFSIDKSDTIKTGISDENIKKIYRKLAILFHPDKFNKCDLIFIIIMKYVEDNDYESLEYIYNISHHIIKYTDDNILNLSDVIDSLNTKENLKYLCNFIENNNDINKFVKNKDGEIINGNLFNRTTAYQWYMSDNKTKNNIESLFMTEEELINHLKNDYIMPNERDFYVQSGNKTLIFYILERLASENALLREQIKNNSI